MMRTTIQTRRTLYNRATATIVGLDDRPEGKGRAAVYLEASVDDDGRLVVSIMDVVGDAEIRLPHGAHARICYAGTICIMKYRQPRPEPPAVTAAELSGKPAGGKS